MNSNNNSKNKIFREILNLRKETGAPISLCKSMFEKHNYVFEDTLEELKDTYMKSKKNVNDGEFVPGQSFNGLNIFKLNAERNIAINMLLTCDTEFVEANREFQIAGSRIAHAILSSIEENSMKFQRENVEVENMSLNEFLAHLSLKFHERIFCRVKLYTCDLSQEKIMIYNHHDLKKCSLIIYSEFVRDEHIVDSYQTIFSHDNFNLTQNDVLARDLCIDYILSKAETLTSFLDSKSCIYDKTISSIIDHKLNINKIIKFTNNIISE